MPSILKSKVSSFIEIVMEHFFAIQSNQNIPVPQTFLEKTVVIATEMILKIIEQILKMVEVLE